MAPILVPTAFLYFYLPETKNRSVAEVRADIKELPTLKAPFGQLRKHRVHTHAILF